MSTSYKISLIAISAVVFFFIFFDIGNFIFKNIPPDTISYIEASDMLYKEMLPHPTRPLGYAFIAGLPNFIIPDLSNNQYILFAICINFFSWIGSILIFHQSLKLYFTDKVSFLFSLFLIFSFGGIAQIFWMLTESIIALILSLIIYYSLKYTLNKEIKYLILAASLLNITIMIKPGFIYLGIIASLVLCFYLINIGIKAILKRYIITFIISLGLVVFQYIAMYQVYDKVTPSFIDKITWYNYLGAKSYAATERVPLNSVIESRQIDLSNKSYKEISRICTQDLKNQMQKNPTVVFKLWALNIMENSISGSAFILAIKKEHTNKYISFFAGMLYIITRFQNLFFMLLFLCSSLMILKNVFKSNIIVCLLASMAVYTIITSGISFWQGDRFHFVLYPLIMVIFLLLIKDKASVQKWLKEQ